MTGHTKTHTAKGEQEAKLPAPPTKLVETETQKTDAKSERGERNTNARVSSPTRVLNQVKVWLHLKQRPVSIWLPVIISASLLVVTLEYTRYAKRQWQAASAQALLAQQSLTEGKTTREIENRAYVFLNFIQFDNTIGSGKPIRLAYRFENTGKTPALNVSVLASMTVSKIGLDEQMELAVMRMRESLPELARQGHWNEERAVLPPGMPFRGGEMIDRGRGATGWFTKEEVQRMKDGERFHLFGNIDYCDIFGKRWDTEFCLYNVSTDSVEFAFCPRHNAYTEQSDSGKCQKAK